MRPIAYDEARGIFSLGKKFYHRLTNEEKLLILEEEERAWAEGIKFIKNKGFNITDDFYKKKTSSITSYKRALFPKLK
jgi:hypothetical protein